MQQLKMENDFTYFPDTQSSWSWRMERDAEDAIVGHQHWRNLRNHHISLILWPFWHRVSVVSHISKWILHKHAYHKRFRHVKQWSTYEFTCGDWQLSYLAISYFVDRRIKYLPMELKNLKKLRCLIFDSM